MEYEKKYSKSVKLKYGNISNLDSMCGVYELLSVKKHKYHYKNSNTIYVGSTNNIKRRLSEYIKTKGHTKKLKDFILNNEIYFRFITSYDYLNLEKGILNSFYRIYGEYPYLNSNKKL